MPVLQVGQRVIIMSCWDTEEYDGQEGILARIDSDDEHYPYKVEFDNGNDIWANSVEIIDCADTLHDAISAFMQGKIALGCIQDKLGLGQVAIIQMNTGDGEIAHGGPYILIWRSLDDRIFKWCSSDNFMRGTNYRFSASMDIRLKQEIVGKSREYAAYTLELGQSGLGAHIKERLALDMDYSRASNSDNTVHHSQIANAIISAIPITAQPIVSTISQSGEFQMTNKIQAIVARGKSSVSTAAQIQAGKALNVTIMKGLKAKAPMMARGYLDHPVAPALVAVLMVAGSEFIPAGPARDKVAKAADLMLVAALTDGADKFLDVEGMIDKAFAGLPAEAQALLS